jgi:uncharacterized delta-60 repeat protein
MKKTTLTLISILFAVTIAFGQPGPLPADLDRYFGPNGDGIQPAGTGYTLDVLTDASDNIYVNHSNSFSVHQPDGAMVASVPCPFVDCRAMTLQQSNSYLIVAGVTNDLLGIARYDSNFQLDPTFGNGGITFVSFGIGFLNFPRAVLEANGQIYVTGLAGDQTTGGQFVARFKSNGNLDSGFANTGYVLESSIYHGNALAMQKSNIVVAGARYGNGTSSQTTITVYNQNGQQSNGFNGGQIFAINGVTPSMKVDSENRIIFTGPTDFISTAIVRLYPNGQFDQSFGGTGIVRFPVQSTSYFNAIALDRKNRITLVGTWYDQTQTSGGIAPQYPFIARYNYRGNLDRSFDNSIPSQFNYPLGIRIFDYHRDPRVFSGIALQTTGKIVVVEYQNAPPSNVQLLRFNGN